jgi:hypothetical protein
LANENKTLSKINDAAPTQTDRVFFRIIPKEVVPRLPMPKA